MATIISLLNTKGGVGKTTSSMMIAEAARRAGYSSAVLDADPQGSASEWAEGAASSGTPLAFTVQDANRATMSRKAEAADVDYLFIDAAPNDPAVIQAAASLADLVVIPTSSAPAEMDRARQTYHSIDGAVALLLWNVDRRKQLYRQARELLEAEDIATFTAEIPTREDINKLWFTSLSLSSLYGYDDVFDELHAALNPTTTGVVK